MCPHALPQAPEAPRRPRMLQQCSHTARMSSHAPQMLLPHAPCAPCAPRALHTPCALASARLGSSGVGCLVLGGSRCPAPAAPTGLARGSAAGPGSPSRSRMPPPQALPQRAIAAPWISFSSRRGSDRAAAACGGLLTASRVERSAFAVSDGCPGRRGAPGRSDRHRRFVPSLLLQPGAVDARRFSPAACALPGNTECQAVPLFFAPKRANRAVFSGPPEPARGPLSACVAVLAAHFVPGRPLIFRPGTGKPSCLFGASRASTWSAACVRGSAGGARGACGAAPNSSS